MRTWGTMRGGTTGFAAGLAAVATACAVAGCGGAASPPATATPSASGAGSQTSTPATPATATPSPVSPSVSSSAPGTASGSGPSARAATPGGTPACQTSGLRVSLGQAEGAAGSVYQNIDFTNTTSTPCTLYGFPGVALLGGTPASQIGAAAQRSPQATPALVTLPAGGTATALLRITQAANYPSSVCQPVTATTLQVYPPDQTGALLLPYKATGCGSDAVKLLTIGVVQAGTGG